MGSSHTDFAALDAAIEEARGQRDWGRVLGLIAANLSDSDGAPHLMRDVGAALEALDRNEDATDLYSDLVLYAAEINRPLDALLALKALARVSAQDAEDLAVRLADLYSAGSSAMAAGSTPVALPTDGAVLVEPIGEDALIDVMAENALLACQAFTQSERPRVAASPIPLLSDLAAEDLRYVVQSLTVETHADGERLVDRGQTLPGLWWLARGGFTVTDERHGPRALSGPNILVGLECLYGESSPTAITCMGCCDLLFLPKERLAELMNERPHFRERVRKVFARYEIHQAVSRCELFRRLPMNEHAHLLTHFAAHRVLAGQVLVRQGVTSPGLFLVTSGLVELRTENGTTPALMQPLGPGELAGLLGLDGNEQAPYTAIAAVNTRVLFLARERLEEALAQHPTVRGLLRRAKEDRAAVLGVG